MGTAVRLPYTSARRARGALHQLAHEHHAPAATHLGAPLIEAEVGLSKAMARIGTPSTRVAEAEATMLARAALPSVSSAPAAPAAQHGGSTAS
jgi:hypothetical protein